ncbi:MAG: type 1 glutamine amidotransferase [Pseudonocardia sp.]
MKTQPVLVIEHEGQCPPAWVGDWLVEAGQELDVRRPYRGEALPDDLSGHGSMVVLGGSMDAYADDEYPWLRQTKDLIRIAAADGTPTLGICLGHQLIAVALGGKVEKNPLGQQMGAIRLGWLPAAAADELFSLLGDSRVGVMWNSDIVSELPDRAVVLARTTRDEVQVARFGPRMWGTQTHPEIGHEILAEWAEHDRADCLTLGLDVDEYVAEVAAARDELRSTWNRLAHRFAKLSREVTPAW